MREEIAYESTARSEWPVFSMRYTFNPDDVAPEREFEPNEAVIYDATSEDDGRWMSAVYGSYVSITDIR